MKNQAPSVLRLLRVVRGATQADLAAACGISATTLSHVENGRLRLPSELVSRVAAALECDSQALRRSQLRPEETDGVIAALLAACLDDEDPARRPGPVESSAVGSRG